MSLEADQTPSQLFSQAESFFRKGYLSQSKKISQNLLSLQSSSSRSLNPTLHYDCLINLSTICLQQNKLEQARQFLYKAIKLNPSRFQAFYNLSITNFYSKSHFKQSIQCLKQCLALLYLELGILTVSLKLLNKSISLNDKNAKAYIQRALYYENNQKIKLASNEFEKLTFEHDEYGFDNTIMAEIYLQKTLFFRRVGNTEKIQENLTLYLKHKQEAIYQQIKLSQNITLLLIDGEKQENLSPTQLTQLKQKITEMATEAKQLMKQIEQEKANKKQPQTQLVQENIKQKVENNKDQSLPQVLLIETQKPTNMFEPEQQENLLDNQAQFPSQKSVPHQDENPSISINEDEDSAILNQKIQQLQRQIKQSGGNVPEIKDLSRNSEQQNFLEFEIQKTIEQINNQKQQSSKIKQTIQKLPSPGISGISQGKISSNGDIRDSISMRSKLTQAYEIDLQEMKTYKSFNLELRSVTMFEQKGPRKDSYAKVKYFTHELLTEKCKTDKLTWNHRFEEMTIKHLTLQDQTDDEKKYEFSIEVHAKDGGWLSWKSDLLIGTGVIKLTQKGATKCTLEKDGKKVGILYYKVKLHKLEEQKE